MVKSMVFGVLSLILALAFSSHMIFDKSQALNTRLFVCSVGVNIQAIGVVSNIMIVVFHYQIHASTSLKVNCQ